MTEEFIRISDKPLTPSPKDRSTLLGFSFIGGFVGAVVVVSLGLCAPVAVGAFAAIGLGVAAAFVVALLALCISCCWDAAFDTTQNKPGPSSSF